MRACWTTFEGDFRRRLEEAADPSWRETGFQDELLRTVLQDTSGYAGCELVRRTVGFAHVLDYDSVEPEAARLAVGRQNLRLGRTLILEAGEMHTYDDFERRAWTTLDEEEHR